MIIVGAGLAGLVAAQSLAAEGRASVVLEKAPTPGGRLATTRLAGAAMDSGAQFFTVRDADFAQLVHDWRVAGLARTWCHGFGAVPDGFPRYFIEGGMHTLAVYLAADAHVEYGTGVTRVEPARVVVEDGRVFESDTIVVTAPVPAALSLLDPAANWQIDDALRSVRYAPCLAALVVLDRPSLVPEPGGCQLTPADDPTFSFVGDNQQKDISGAPALTLHANDEVSAGRFDDDPDTTLAWLLSRAERYIGEAKVLDAKLERWRFARPVRGHPERCVAVSFEPLVVLAGDGFGGAKVEGAALSGLFAATSILSVG